MDKETLEWQQRNFYEVCERCQSKLIVHAFRKKSPGKQKIVYCHCENKACGKFNMEIAFRGG